MRAAWHNYNNKTTSGASLFNRPSASVFKRRSHSTAQERSTRRNSQSNRPRSVNAARIGTLIDLIDIQFRRFVTPIIVKFVYLVYILNVISGFLGLIYMVVAGPLSVMTDTDLSTQERAGGIIGGFAVVVCLFIFYTVFSLAGLLAVRLALETCLVLFRIEEHLANRSTGDSQPCPRPNAIT